MDWAVLVIHLEERLRAENKEIGALFAIGFLRLQKNPLLGVDGRPNMLVMTLYHKFRLSISTALKLVGSNRSTLGIHLTSDPDLLLPAVHCLNGDVGGPEIYDDARLLIRVGLGIGECWELTPSEFLLLFVFGRDCYCVRTRNLDNSQRGSEELRLRVGTATVTIWSTLCPSRSLQILHRQTRFLMSTKLILYVFNSDS